MEAASNPDLQLAFDFVKYTNRNIFLTGKAGTGKTTFLHNLKKTLPKRMIVLAPTGVAAINAGGVTIHSFFQLAFHPFVPALYLDEKIDLPEPEKGGYKMSREKVNIIRSLDLLVIDEISMVRADLLDAVDSGLRRYRNRDLPFGGIQLLMIGDLQQLAPVAREDDLQILGNYYKELFFFGSHALRSTDYVTIELKHIYRQSDQVFINLLNKVRENKIDSEVLDELNKRYIPGFDTESDGGYITLTTHNHQSKTLNDSKLEKLPGKPHSFMASINDDFPESAYPNENELILKKGAQVMFVKNDISRDKLFFNGKIGKVQSFDEDAVIVACKGDDHTIRVARAEWQNVKYSLNDSTKEIEETVIGTFTQYPLKLAWAITIHKSQGLTFDRAVIDAKDAFAHGQVYVALSRCRTLEGVVLSTRLSQRCMVGNESVTEFIRASEQNQPGPKELSESKRTYQLMLLTELFDFTPLLRGLSYCVKVLTENKSSILGDPREKLEDALLLLKNELTGVSEKFRLQLERLTNNGVEAEENSFLQERIMKGGEYFLSKLKPALKDVVSGISIETDNRDVRKTVNEALNRLRKDSHLKLLCLEAVTTGFELGKYLEIKAKAAIEGPEPRSRQPGARVDYTGEIKHTALLKALKEWRTSMAKKHGLSEYMILQQKTLVNITHVLPQSLKDLKRVKGIGKRKIVSYGEAIVEIVRSFCMKENIVSENDPDNTADEIKKEKKEPTKYITLKLFRAGNSIEQIALERNINPRRVEEHLAHFIESGDIAVLELIPEEKLTLISKYFNNMDELRLSPVKEVLGDSVSWGELRFVSNHIRFLRKSGETQS